MNAQAHIERAEELLNQINNSTADYRMVRVRAAEAHIKLAKWKYRHGETVF